MLDRVIKEALSPNISSIRPIRHSRKTQIKAREGIATARENCKTKKKNLLLFDFEQFRSERNLNDVDISEVLRNTKNSCVNSQEELKTMNLEDALKAIKKSKMSQNLYKKKKSRNLITSTTAQILKRINEKKRNRMMLNYDNIYRRLSKENYKLSRKPKPKKIKSDDPLEFSVFKSKEESDKRRMTHNQREIYFSKALDNIKNKVINKMKSDIYTDTDQSNKIMKRFNKDEMLDIAFPIKNLNIFEEPEMKVIRAKSPEVNERKISLLKIKKLVRPQTSNDPFNGFKRYNRGIYHSPDKSSKDTFLVQFEAQILKSTEASESVQKID
ncbi:unnamed protein product [Moneuplotes crassus]|uniref:Uncharacterized protein n=1 Tax=Euplotes crassus TaxID=5936 RepID=A0AAD1UR17_EUPCR|nr:unnamed protein product [Moneuplotes crassus]